MSSAIISEHIPDIDLITSYAERQDTVFSRVSPWTKLLLLMGIVLTITITRNLIILTILYALILACCWLGGLPMKKIVAWYTMPVIFVISLVGILMWTQPGIPVFSAGIGVFTLNLTDQGVLLVVTLLLKALISVTFSLLFLMTTRYQHFSGMISRIFPSPLDQVFLLAYRFLFLTLSMAGAIIKAVRSRGGGIIRSARLQGQVFAEVFGLVFIRSFEQAERVQKAMTARGYNGTYRAVTDIPRPGIAECAVLCAAGLAIICIALLPSHAGGW